MASQERNREGEKERENRKETREQLLISVLTGVFPHLQLPESTIAWCESARFIRVFALGQRAMCLIFEGM